MEVDAVVYMSTVEGMIPGLVDTINSSALKKYAVGKMGEIVGWIYMNLSRFPYIFMFIDWLSKIDSHFQYFCLHS